MLDSVNFRMVRLGRELRGWTQTALAQKAGIPQARLSRIEAGQLAASAEDADGLARALGFPAAFLLEPGTPVAAPLFRKRAIRSVRQLASIQGRLNVAVLVAQRLFDAGVELEPALNFPDAGQFPPDEPVEAAIKLRRDWRLPAGPIDDVTEIIEAAGGVVLRVDFGTTDASAAYLPTMADGRQWFIVNTQETAGDRVRLSLAHELGHAVLHRVAAGYDEAEMELQAFTFAAGLLLPPGEFDRAVPADMTLNDARKLKRVYGVSIQAIVRAAFDRGRISRERYTSLYKQISARQWRTVEPDPIPVEASYAWDEVLRVHRDHHGYSDEELAAIARVTPQLLNDLYPEHFQSVPRSPLRVFSSSLGIERPRE